MLYEMTDKNLVNINRTSFQEQGVLEVDLQEALREHPEFIEDGLFVIADEFTGWEDSFRYIDLLCIDSNGQLVVVELKRGDGVHMELQAIRYAAMMANFQTHSIIEGHAHYLRNKNLSESAEERIREHLGLTSDDEISIATERPRIILVSEDFNREITTSVLWLNETGLDIRCVRVRAYKDQGRLLLDIDQVIPLPEAQDYLVKARDREQEVRSSTPLAPQDGIPGTTEFEELIKALPLEKQQQFDDVLEFIREIDAAGLGEPFSFSYMRGGGAVRLLLPGGRNHLAYFSCESGGTPYVGLRRSSFNLYASAAIERVWSALGKNATAGQSAWASAPFSEELFAALREAYQLANNS